MAQTAKRDGFCEELQPSESLIKFMRQTFTNINFVNALLALRYYNENAAKKTTHCAYA